MLARVKGVVLSGVLGEIITVEVDHSDGLPGLGLVGLPDTSVSESQWRARCALASIGAAWPKHRVTINLSPAEVRKHGTGLDLPIAVGLLCVLGQIDQSSLDRVVLIGELSLDGSVRPARGAAAGAIAARRAGASTVVVDDGTAAELVGMPGIAVRCASSLSDLLACLRGEREWPRPPAVEPTIGCDGVDLADVRGHLQGRLAIEVAAAGSHHVALVGSPGVGKTMLASTLAGLLPDLDDDAALEVASIHAVAGRHRLSSRRPPFEAPHHSASASALLGSVHGHRVTPGAATLAHGGALFLDEAPEFARPSLEGLRQPLECGEVSISRSGWSGRLPARFQLVLTANPCPCGRRVAGGACSCPAPAIRRYAARLSGPLMDRVDVRILVTRPTDAELSSSAAGESSDAVRARITTARARAAHRFAGCAWQVNAQLPAGELRRLWAPTQRGAQMLQQLEKRSDSLRGPDRVLRMAWTIADLAGADRPDTDHVAQAIALRGGATGWPA